MNIQGLVQCSNAMETERQALQLFHGQKIWHQSFQLGRKKESKFFLTQILEFQDHYQKKKRNIFQRIMIKRSDTNDKQKSLKLTKSNSSFSQLIDNYYGAHKNIKTNFRNKLFQEVYEYLSHRMPSQPEYMSLYYQDLLISIIKTIDLFTKSNEYRGNSLEPFFINGTKAISEFYWMFLKERMVIFNQMVINPSMRGKISYFFTLLIDFSTKIAEKLKSIDDYQNCSKIYEMCYIGLIKNIISSSTQNFRLLKKTSQFLLNYGIFKIDKQQWSQSFQILHESLSIQLNCLIVLRNKEEKEKTKQSKIKSKMKSTVKPLIKILLALAIVAEKQSKFLLRDQFVLDAFQLKGKFFPELKESQSKKKEQNFIKEYQKEKNKQIQLIRICSMFFSIDEIRRKQDEKKDLELNTMVKKQKKNVQAVGNQSDPLQKRFISKKSILSVGRWAFGSLYRRDESHLKNQNLQKYKEAAPVVNRNHKNQKEVRFQLNTQEKRKSNSLNYKSATSFVFSDNNQDTNFHSSKNNNNNSNSNVNLSTPDNSQRKFMSQKKMKSETLLPQKKIQPTSKREKKPSIVVNEKKMDYMDSGFLLFDQKFWELTDENQKIFAKNNATKKSIAAPRPSRRLSFTNINILTAASKKNSLKAQNSNLQKFLKSNQFSVDATTQTCKKNQGILKRKINKQKKNIFFQQKNNIPNSYQQITQKVTKWHEKNDIINAEISIKAAKLKQRNRKKVFSEDIIGQIDEIGKQKRQNSNQKEDQRNSGMNDERKGIHKKGSVSAMNIFRQFLTKNAEIIGITKLQLFVFKEQSQPLQKQKSQIPSEKIEQMKDKIFSKTKQTIEHFLKEKQNVFKQQIPQKKSIAYSNKKQSKSVAEQIQMKNSQIVSEWSQQQKHEIPCNLFISSLKNQVENYMRYL